MKVGFPYKKDDIIPIYDNWETQDKIIGTAKLVSFIQHGRSFILEDTYPETEQIVYNYDEWSVSELKSKDSWSVLAPMKIRFIDTIGLTNSASDEEYDPDFDSKLPKDNFITVNGIQCF